MVLLIFNYMSKRICTEKLQQYVNYIVILVRGIVTIYATIV